MTGNKRKPHSPPSVSNAEWEVMKTIWDGGAMAARDVFAALPEGHGWAYRTLKTLLARLVAKGALDYDQVGNSYLYRPFFTREQMTRVEVKGFVERIFDGSIAPVLAHFIEEEELSDEDVVRLQEMLDGRKGGAKKRTRKRQKGA